MNLRTYRARTMAQALDQVKQDLGKEAVILHTRVYRVGGVMGVGGHDEYEITAADASVARGPTLKQVPPAQPPPSRMPGPAQRGSAPERPATQAAPPEHSPFTPAFFTALGAPAATAGQSTPHVEPARESARELPRDAPTRQSAGGPGTRPVGTTGATAHHSSGPPAEPAGAGTPRGLAQRNAGAIPDPPSVLAMQEELAQIKRLMGQLLSESRRVAVAHEVSGGAGGGSGGLMDRVGLAQPLLDLGLALQDAGVKPERIDQVLGSVRDELKAEDLREPRAVRAAALRCMTGWFPLAPELREPFAHAGRDGSRDGPLTIALIGPTGVGKTTTIAKLAAHYALRHGASVGLVSADTYRIAAVEQLRTYAGIMGLPLRVALTPQDVTDACEALSRCDVILVDTAGRSQHDAIRLDELAAFVNAARPRQTHLVLSVAASEDVQVDAARRFRVLAPTHLLLTKLDEAVRYGCIANVVPTTGLRLGYVTTGQEVPAQIEYAQADRLAQLVLTGMLTPPREPSAPRAGPAARDAAASAPVAAPAEARTTQSAPTPAVEVLPRARAGVPGSQHPAVGPV